ncbi:MAG: hypothetical protein LBG64_00875 [Pseudomonadales bacterium]|jgi:hypothetical protein|nr:hypothetical protein [Pseudomonadales bacterium]
MTSCDKEKLGEDQFNRVKELIAKNTDRKTGVIDTKPITAATKLTAASIKSLAGVVNYLDYRLSQTTRSALDLIFIEVVFDRKKMISSKEMLKGTIVESDSLSLYQEVTGELYFKNNERFSNAYIEGTPDVTTSPNRIIDIKSSWSLWTYDKVTEDSAKSDYFWQIVGYGWLTKKKAGEVAHCLVDTINPDDADENPLRDYINYQITKEAADIREKGDDGDYLTQDEIEQKLLNHYVFSDIPAAFRLKRSYFTFGKTEFDRIKEEVVLWRQYLNKKLDEFKKLTKTK